MSYFEKVKDMAQELGFVPENENIEEELFTVSDSENGINCLVVDCEDPVLVLEMVVMSCTDSVNPVRLLQMNREMVHGAFVLDDSAQKVIWRDTLQIENLDLNELQGSISALSLALSENANEIIRMSKGGK
ncbi:MAG: YbjN domain-containing protein [Deltaproteobacteria bacterium]|nr:YbjN domain-containing protein [Deltaproteobacteria bacterium]